MTPEQLASIRIIVTHRYADSVCPDGLASALILQDVLPNARIVFLDHNSQEHREIPAEPGMLFCDIVPTRERAQEFVDAGAWVLDHHKHSKDIVDMFGDRGVFADETKEQGVSGAVLAYREVWVAGDYNAKACARTWLEICEFARLAGIRDTWQKANPSWRLACEQAEMLRFQGEAILSKGGLDHALSPYSAQLGNVLFERAIQRAKSLALQAYAMRVNDMRIAAIPSKEISDAADHIDGVDIVAGFQYRVENSVAGQQLKLEVSLRSRTGVDVGALAKKLGGGGHTAAAGFALNSYPQDDTGPYEKIARALLTASASD